ncbi:hypothetical protein NYE67_11000 [Solibacillus sp. FSL W8-0474]
MFEITEDEKHAVINEFIIDLASEIEDVELAVARGLMEYIK